MFIIQFITISEGSLYERTVWEDGYIPHFYNNFIVQHIYNGDVAF